MALRYNPAQFKNVAKLVFKVNTSVSTWADCWEDVYNRMVQHVTEHGDYISRSTTNFGTGGYVIGIHRNARKVWFTAYVDSLTLGNYLNIEMQDEEVE